MIKNVPHVDLKQLEQEALDKTQSIQAKKAIWTALGKLYLAWDEQGPTAFYTQMKLEVLMRLYDNRVNQ